jgi:hypothetical protein
LSSGNQRLLTLLNPEKVEVVIQLAEEAEADEMWSFVGRKKDQRGLWHALDHHSGKILTYVFGRRQDEVFLKLKRFWSRLALRVIIRTNGVLTPVISTLITISLASDTRRRLSASI